MSKVELLDWMGDDLAVANAARVSFNKESEWDYQVVDHELYPSFAPGEDEYRPVYGKVLKEKDKRLIQFLARGMTKAEYNQILSDVAASNNVEFIQQRLKDLDTSTHWTPFGQVVVKFRLTMPIFVARQYFRHNVGLVRNEVSRRYVTDDPSFHRFTWRGQAENVKQGSAGEVSEGLQRHYDLAHLELTNKARRLYDEAIYNGIAPEQARAVLPQSTETQFIETGSLAAYARICEQRLDSHAQKEIQEVAAEIDKHMRGLFPVSWAALMGRKYDT